MAENAGNMTAVLATMCKDGTAGVPDHDIKRIIVEGGANTVDIAGDGVKDIHHF